MPRWKALPDDLDPQIREFAGQLRRLVDRSGLNINAVADRTGYSRTSWERYLNGRLLAPRGAVVALAEVTGTPQHHLTTMWELAERAWSRAEMRHDRTMETIRISQARAALGELDGAADAPAGGGTGRFAAAARHGASGTDGPSRGGHDPARPPSLPQQRGAQGARRSAQGGHGQRRAKRGGAAPGGRRKGAMLAVGAVGALIVVVGAVLLAPGDEPAVATPSPAASPTASPELPVGVECNGTACSGEDPEAMGCGGDFARTVSSAVVGGSKLEVRYSEVCSAAWARLTEAAVGDTVRITAGTDGQDGEVMGDTDAYTPMVAVRKAADAKACATLNSAATKGCTDPGR